MAAVSLSPAPVHHLSAMSTRRVPLGNNPNVVNSPLRSHLAAAQAGKRLRSHADMQREDAYGHPPPAKRQMVDHNVQRPVTTTQRTTRAVAQRLAAGGQNTERAQQTTYKPSEKEVDNVRQWQAQTRSRFPKMVFYFESIPDEQRMKLGKHVTHLGARVEQFFSINITHVVTTRQIPSEKSAQDDTESSEQTYDQPKTIDPSLLNRQAQATTDPLRRKLLFDNAASRRIPVQIHEDVVRKPKPRNTDVLHKARDMGKKIWSLEKLQKILDMVLEPDPYKSALLGQGQRNGAAPGTAASKQLDELLRQERVHGPSDTVAAKELHYFKGPYIYIYDIEEKQKPIMVREYPKVADKKAGEWPQFRVASAGRCPFVEDKNYTVEEERPRAKEQVTKAAAATRAEIKPSKVSAAKPVMGKRTLAEMEDGHNRGAAPVREVNVVAEHVKPTLDAFRENFFTSHGNGKAPRFVAGEPVASGVQPSKLTSAIRSNMISSTSGILGGTKAGTSKEIHGLQRQVLQKHTTPAVSTDLSSRRMGDGSNAFIRSTSVARTTADKHALDMIQEDEGTAADRVKLRRATRGQGVTSQVKQKKRDLKPGYCENCADKFDDFDEHILTKKHRKYAENGKNWEQLDMLLSQLTRRPKYPLDQEEVGEEEW